MVAAIVLIAAWVRTLIVDVLWTTATATTLQAFIACYLTWNMEPMT